MLLFPFITKDPSGSLYTRCLSAFINIYIYIQYIYYRLWNRIPWDLILHVYISLSLSILYAVVARYIKRPPLYTMNVRHTCVLYLPSEWPPSTACSVYCYLPSRGTALNTPFPNPVNARAQLTLHTRNHRAMCLSFQVRCTDVVSYLRGELSYALLINTNLGACVMRTRRMCPSMSRDVMLLLPTTASWYVHAYRYIYETLWIMPARLSMPRGRHIYIYISQ